MRKLLAGLGIGVALALTGCAGDPVVVTGTIESKYIEDFVEFQLVLKENGTGTIHHFEVTPEVWRAAVVGQPFSNQQVAGDDD